MVKKTMTYEDYDGNVRTEDFYFDLSETELAEMELGVSGGLTAMIERIVNANDQKEIVKLFKKLILKSYGKKSPDGRFFVKDKKYSKEFKSTRAYNKLFMELATNADAAADFVNSVIPKDLASKVGNDALTVSATTSD